MVGSSRPVKQTVCFLLSGFLVFFPCVPKMFAGLLLQGKVANARARAYAYFPGITGCSRRFTDGGDERGWTYQPGRGSVRPVPQHKHVSASSLCVCVCVCLFVCVFVCVCLCVFVTNWKSGGKKERKSFCCCCCCCCWWWWWKRKGKENGM